MSKINYNCQLIPKGYSLLQTEDQSTTLFSEKYQESLHSKFGAQSETKQVYLKSCEIENFAQNFSELNIFEVGFGMGTGYLETIEFLTLLETKTKLFYLSIEQDYKLIEWLIQQNKFESELYPIFSDLKLFQLGSLDIFSAQKNGHQLNILMGNGRQTLPDFLNQKPLHFHAIYQDAFSVRKNAELWTVEWFELLARSMHQNGLLSTYAISSVARKSMIEAGFKVFHGDNIINKKGCTIAKFSGEMTIEMLEHLNRSPMKALRDRDIKK